MLGTGQHAPVRGVLGQHGVEPLPGGDDALDGAVHVGPVGVAPLQGGGEVPGGIMRYGISTSRPAWTDRGASRIPKIQSLITKPPNPHSSRSTPVRRSRLSPHHSPFTLL